MAYTTINDPSAHFQAQTYTGGGASSTVTNTGNSNLQPDLLWIKRRNADYGHNLFDTTRGIAKLLEPQSTGLENTNQTWISGVGSDSFTIGVNEHNLSNSAGTYIAWQWKVAGGTTSSNSDGNITTTLQTNSTAGISVGTYTGAGSSPDNKTIGHGLGAIPDLVMIKGRDGSGLGGAAQYWVVGAPNTSLFGNGGNKHLFLDGTQALMDNSTVWRSANFTTTTIPLGGHAAINGSGAAYVFYAFKSVQGFSKIGQYTGNGTTDGAFVFTGFKPNFIMLRETGNTNSWWMFDTARDTYNGADARLAANTTAAEATGSFTNVIDFLSNGFKLRNTDSAWNRNNGTYIYMCFAENPFVTSTGTPTTAR